MVECCQDEFNREVVKEFDIFFRNQIPVVGMKNSETEFMQEGGHIV